MKPGLWLLLVHKINNNVHLQFYITFQFTKCFLIHYFIFATFLWGIETWLFFHGLRNWDSVSRQDFLKATELLRSRIQTEMLVSIMLDIYDCCPENWGSRPRTPAINSVHVSYPPHWNLLAPRFSGPGPLPGTLVDAEWVWTTCSGSGPIHMSTRASKMV